MKYHAKVLLLENIKRVIHKQIPLNTKTPMSSKQTPNQQRKSTKFNESTDKTHNRSTVCENPYCNTTRTRTVSLIAELRKAEQQKQPSDEEEEYYFLGMNLSSKKILVKRA
ncbi:hypothetical protein JTB14_032204 [Gonioctena quinquepunctata]|nr:hypothetical protein JTB14_032204 [Gonioctena quinquepunctata]